MYSRKETIPHEADHIKHHMTHAKIFRAAKKELAVLLDSFPKEKDVKHSKNRSLRAVYWHLFRFKASLPSLQSFLDDDIFSRLPLDLSSECLVDGAEVSLTSLYYDDWCAGPPVPFLTGSSDFSFEDVARIRSLVERFIDIVKKTDRVQHGKQCKGLRQVLDVIKYLDTDQLSV
jgi:hypothetical protein